ncbi:MAG: oligosaccharide flippase family protein [Bacteroidaceae bacterium]|nr:oligosaccharide flippase family protein [Bacteroidaceae bacterium]
MDIRAYLKKYNKIIENFFSISLLNAISQIISFFLVPYLVAVLGFKTYGAYCFIYTIALYLVLFGTYGFRFSVTRQISIHRDDREKVNTIFNAAIAARLMLSAAAAVVVGIAVFLLMDSDDMLMYIFAMGIVFGDVFIPVWLFQGMEQMRYVTIVNVVSKIVFAVLVFVLIKEQSDYIYILILNSCGYIAAGALSMYIAFRQYGLSLALPRWSDIVELLKDGWHIFVSNIGMELYRNSNSFLLGVLVGDTALGIYNSVEKLVKVGQSVINALPMAIFPHASRLFHGGDMRQNVAKLNKMLRVSFVLLFVIALLFACSPRLVVLYLSELDYNVAKYLVWLMSPVVVFGCMNYIAGILGLVNLNASNLFERNIWIAGVTSVALMLLFCKEYTYYAAAAAWSIAETLLFVLCLFSIRSIKNRNMNLVNGAD